MSGDSCRHFGKFCALTRRRRGRAVVCRGNAVTVAVKVVFDLPFVKKGLLIGGSFLMLGMVNGVFTATKLAESGIRMPDPLWPAFTHSLALSHPLSLFLPLSLFRSCARDFCAHARHRCLPAPARDVVADHAQRLAEATAQLREAREARAGSEGQLHAALREAASLKQDKASLEHTLALRQVCRRAPFLSCNVPARVWVGQSLAVKAWPSCHGAMQAASLLAKQHFCKHQQSIPR